MWFAENGAGKIGAVTTGGVISEFTTTTANSGPAEIVEAPNQLVENTSDYAFTENAAGKIGVMDSTGHMINEFVVPAAGPFGLTTDSSGSDLWFTQNGGGGLGQMTSETSGGTINEFTTESYPQSIVENVSDLKLYFTEPGYIGVVSSPSNSPTINEYSTGLPEGASPWGIAEDGNQQIWFTDQGLDAIGLFNTSNHTSTEYSSGITPGDTYPRDIALGPDGAMWFTEWGADKIGRIDPVTDVITEYPVTTGSNPYGIVKDPSGAPYMWFTLCSGAIGKIGPIPGSGVIGGRHRAFAGAHAHASAKLHPKP
jgi:virginiamycin B lyase